MSTELALSTVERCAVKRKPCHLEKESGMWDIPEFPSPHQSLTRPTCILGGSFGDAFELLEICKVFHRKLALLLGQALLLQQKAKQREESAATTSVCKDIRKQRVVTCL